MYIIMSNPIKLEESCPECPRISRKFLRIPQNTGEYPGKPKEFLRNTQQCPGIHFYLIGVESQMYFFLRIYYTFTNIKGMEIVRKESREGKLIVLT